MRQNVKASAPPTCILTPNRLPTGLEQQKTTPNALWSTRALPVIRPVQILGYYFAATEAEAH